MVGDGGCTQAGIKVCVAIGGGAFVEQYVPNPAVGGAHVLTIENGIIFWGQRQAEPPIGPQSVMRRTRPRKDKR
jgi:hypothetical protein